ncbi:hypothetical protein NEOLEDRAFT_1223504, partial [Neolentinus lepideus HHB14362 ss-1]
ECARLALGVSTFDSLAKEQFQLHAYALFITGDIIALEKLLGINGHNAFCPCQGCRIRGFRMESTGGTIYYVPLAEPIECQSGPKQKSWSPDNLPLRTPETNEAAIRAIEEAATKKQKKELICHHVIKKHPVLRCVGSLDHTKCAPWDWMHLFLENNCPNLVKLWTGNFKGLDEGVEEYELSPDDWEQIGQETADAVKDIPASFVRVLANIAQDQSKFTAESWGFWFMYIAPVVLKGRFQNEKYYKHLCDFVDIMKISIQLEITREQVDDLEQKIIQWVREYEE